jgi:hypothetical protein
MRLILGIVLAWYLWSAGAAYVVGESAGTAAAGLFDEVNHALAR